MEQARLQRTVIKWQGGCYWIFNIQDLYGNGTGLAFFCLQEFIVLEHPGGILVAGNLGELMGRVSEFLTIFLLVLFNLSDSWRRS